jgi:hypothetical protein
MKALPKTLYVRRDIDGEDTYLVPTETLREQGDLEERRIVGEYRLVQTLVVSTKVNAVKK